MNEEELEGLLYEFIDHSAENGDLTQLSKTISIGFVVDNDDPLQQGRLRIFCPAYNDNPKKLLHLPWAGYVSPVGGVISQSAYARGHVEGREFSNGPIHYGFWGIPEIGAHALVACINGDPRRRVWLGCFPSHQETHTIGHGRFKHENNEVNGPLTSRGNPIEPTASKLKEAFNNDISSSEWKTRAADYQITSVRSKPSPDKSVYVDDDYETISNNEEDEWVKEILGEHGYDWSGYKNLASFLSSRVYGWTTPGFHSITMDDRPFNSRIRIRTAGGNQILLDDTNERMYFSTSGGKSWLEMDAAGNIDVFAERRLSVHAEKDINFSAGESIRLKANKFISMYAGNTTGQSPLSEQLSTGEIRIQSSNDMHLMSENNLRMNVSAELLANVVGNVDLKFEGELNVEVTSDIYMESLSNINLDSPNIDFRVSGKDTTVNDLIDYLDEYVDEVNAFVDVFNSHTHTGDSGGSTSAPTPIAIDSTKINDEGLPANPAPDPDETKLAPWTNRVPQHEPWPRVVMQDSDDTINSENNGYLNNVDWIEQFDNETSPDGREPIGKTEGDDTIDRGKFWRR